MELAVSPFILLNQWKLYGTIYVCDMFWKYLLIKVFTQSSILNTYFMTSKLSDF